MLPVILCPGFSGKIPASKFELLMYLKAFRALAEPGEAVGLLAAQVSRLIRLKVMSPLIKPCFTGPFGEKKHHELRSFHGCVMKSFGCIIKSILWNEHFCIKQLKTF